MWAASCNNCNCHELTDKVKWPLARVLAIKWLADRAYFDLARFNEIRRGYKQIRWTDVILWICRESRLWAG